MARNYLSQIASKKYYTRSPAYHKTLVHSLLQPCFPAHNTATLRMLSFFIYVVPGQRLLSLQDYPNNTFVMLQANYLSAQTNPELTITLSTISKHRPVPIAKDLLAFAIPYDKYLNCQAMAGSSIEEYIAFMHASEYLCSVPKHKYYYLLRHCKILTVPFEQNVYFAGQYVTAKGSGSGVYLVRRGEIGYIYNPVVNSSLGKAIEVSHFTSGQLFGTLYLTQSKTYSQRIFTAKSTNGQAILYQFSEELFKDIVWHYCANLISSKQRKILKYLPDSHLQSKTNNSSYQKDTKSPYNFDTSFTRKRYKSHSLNLPSTQPTLNIPEQLTVHQSPYTTTLLTRFNSTVSNGYNAKDHSSHNINSYMSNFPSLPSTNTAKKILEPRLSECLYAQYLRKTNYFSLKYRGPLQHYPMTLQQIKYTSSEFRDIDKQLQKNKNSDSKIDQYYRASFRSKNNSNGYLFESFFRKSFFHTKHKAVRKSEQSYNSQTRYWRQPVLTEPSSTKHQSKYMLLAEQSSKLPKYIDTSPSKPSHFHPENMDSNQPKIHSFPRHRHHITILY